jgi:hypothetical protein
VHGQLALHPTSLLCTQRVGNNCTRAAALCLEARRNGGGQSARRQWMHTATPRGSTRRLQGAPPSILTPLTSTHTHTHTHTRARARSPATYQSLYVHHLFVRFHVSHCFTNGTWDRNWRESPFSERSDAELFASSSTRHRLPSPPVTRVRTARKGTCGVDTVRCRRRRAKQAGCNISSLRCVRWRRGCSTLCPLSAFFFVFLGFTRN